jgi:hypothetical protein
MSNRNKLLAAALVAAIAGALTLPLWSSAGTLITERPPLPPLRAKADKPGFVLRCYQYGRLLFEERGLDLAGDAIAGLKLRATGPSGRPVMVTDTGTSTCLIRMDTGDW